MAACRIRHAWALYSFTGDDVSRDTKVGGQPILKKRSDRYLRFDY